MQIERIDHSAAVLGVSGIKKQEPVEDIVLPEEEIAPPAEETEKQPGVLRLLQEGHFKGVADVRLRINFYDELQALESQSRMDAAGSGFAAFNQSLEADTTALKESGELTKAQSAALDLFLEQIRTAQNSYDGTVPFAELMAGMQGQFDTLLGALNPTTADSTEQPEQPLEPAVEEQISALEESLEEPNEQAADEATEPVLLPAETAEEPSVFEQLVTNLRNSFEQALQQLESDVNTAGVLPPLSEASGNGKAYAKFLAIYESMQNGGSVPAAPAEELAGEPAIEA